LVLFGVGLLGFVRDSGRSRPTGLIGASLFIGVGLLSLATATVFPQDAWGSPPTFPGEMHKILSGVIALLSILYMALIGIWFKRGGLFPGFGTYSFITILAVFLSGGLFAAKMGSPIMGLCERIVILIGFQWTFILGLWMSFRGGAS
jgi:hypothetical protein